MGGEEVFFPPYGEEELRAIIGARINQAFIEDGWMGLHSIAVFERRPNER